MVTTAPLPLTPSQLVFAVYMSLTIPGTQEKVYLVVVKTVEGEPTAMFVAKPAQNGQQPIFIDVPAHFNCRERLHELCSWFKACGIGLRIPSNKKENPTNVLH